MQRLPSSTFPRGLTWEYQYNPPMGPAKTQLTVLGDSERARERCLVREMGANARIRAFDRRNFRRRTGRWKAGERRQGWATKMVEGHGLVLQYIKAAMIAPNHLIDWLQSCTNRHLSASAA